MSVDPRAATGFAGVTDAYARGRPGYPTEAIDRIVAELELDEASSVLDLAAGTGQLSRLVHTRIRHIFAVEPVQPMRARIVDDLPGVTVLDGTAEAIPLPDCAVDAVLVGEAFHWFSTVPATAEIDRILSPEGGLALLWNTPT
ncbi:class I SAM-dependent methyltransferase [Dietzia cercidiphylli]|jgi:ubiquinone/menaquinone biosynthesis C-methylase UbiE|uniref:class I SAM-dependent methyltransferase n=1 Tax=Dietzia cercidiphylli TaxID=498199 RepID=UPI003F80BCED